MNVLMSKLETKIFIKRQLNPSFTLQLKALMGLFSCMDRQGLEKLILCWEIIQKRFENWQLLKIVFQMLIVQDQEAELQLNEKIQLAHTLLLIWRNHLLLKDHYILDLLDNLWMQSLQRPWYTQTQCLIYVKRLRIYDSQQVLFQPQGQVNRMLSRNTCFLIVLNSQEMSHWINSFHQPNW